MGRELDLIEEIEADLKRASAANPKTGSQILDEVRQKMEGLVEECADTQALIGRYHEIRGMHNAVTANAERFGKGAEASSEGWHCAPGGEVAQRIHGQS